jgi:hypothetical protein
MKNVNQIEAKLLTNNKYAFSSNLGLPPIWRSNMKTLNANSDATIKFYHHRFELKDRRVKRLKAKSEERDMRMFKQTHARAIREGQVFA